MRYPDDDSELTEEDSEDEEYSEDADEDEDEDEGDEDEEDDYDEYDDEGEFGEEGESEEDEEDDEDSGDEFYSEGDEDGDDEEGEEESSEEDETDDEFQDEEFEEDEYDGDLERGFVDDEDDDREEKGTDRDRLRKMIALVCCCCCCLIIILVVVLIIALGGSDDTDTPVPSPTPAPVATGVSPTAPVAIPTQAPQGVLPSAFVPTDFPTVSPQPTNRKTPSPTPKPSAFPTASPSISAAPTKTVPDELLLNPGADTTIYIDGFDAYKYGSFGDRNTLLVQNGRTEINEIPDSFIMFQYDISDLPGPERLIHRERTAVLILQHVVASNADELSSANLTVYRLPATNQDVETLHGGFYNDIPEGVKGPTFSVHPLDTEVQVDITYLLFGQPPYNGTVQSRAVYEDPSQLMLMIANEGAAQEIQGDRFHSRETNEPPELYIDIRKIELGENETYAPTPSYTSANDTGANETAFPSMAPSIANASFAPSTSPSAAEAEV
eukprot:Nitzschia sp. Nitz4//scaffold113_size70149//17816//19303//NITZ4_005944-RA/size70149-processed-gene-0.55-mRNA-1//1//CDS//3329533323//4410//frame0